MESNIETLPYQPHSETSIQAARLKNDAQADRDKILNMICAKEIYGLTNDQISKRLGKDSSFYSPRLIELERAGKIVKLTFTRKTRKDRNANIYVCSEFQHGRKIYPVKKEQKTDPLLNQMDIKVLEQFIRKVDMFDDIIVRKDSPVYKAIKRLAGL